jgi:hypothetical protein
MEKITIDRYWMLNLWEAIDGEFIEIDGSPDDYLGLDVSDELQLNMVIKELLLPQLNCFNDEDKEKINNSLFFNSKYLLEEELLQLMIFFGGTVFNTPNERG